MEKKKFLTDICLFEFGEDDLNMDMMVDDSPFDENGQTAESSSTKDKDTQEEADDSEESIAAEFGYKEPENAEGDSNIFDDPEKVGEKDKQQGEDKTAKGNKPLESSSTNPISSILSALKADGVLPDVDDTLITSAKTAEDFATIIEKQVDARLDAAQQRVKQALDAGVPDTEVRNYEMAINYLDSLTEDSIIDETDEGEDLRGRLIYQDYINKGFKPERAAKEVEKSKAAGSDIEDAKAALEANKEFYSKGYEALKAEKAAKVEADKRAKEAEKSTFQKKVLETEEPFAGIKVDKTIRQQILDNATKLVEKDSDGNLLTPVQKYIKENPVDAQYYISLLYTMTGGFKNLDKLVGKKVAQATKQAFSNVDKMFSSSPGFTDSGNSLFNDENMNAIPRLDIP